MSDDGVIDDIIGLRVTSNSTIENDDDHDDELPFVTLSLRSEGGGHLRPPT